MKPFQAFVIWFSVVIAGFDLSSFGYNNGDTDMGFVFTSQQQG